MRPGGTILVDSTLIGRKVARTDVTVHYIPATALASDNNMPTLANMIIMGKLLAEMNQFEGDSVDRALAKVISARHKDMLAVNKTAMEIGSKA